MPLRYADVFVYLVAAAVPLALLALFSVFRWYYLRAVDRAIHAEPPAADFSSGPPPGSLPHAPLTLVDEYPTRAAIPEPGLVVARREESAYRAALALSGLLFVVLAALLTWWGQLYQGNRAAASIAYSCTLPGILLMVVFLRRSWIAAVAWLTTWLAVGLLLHVVWLRIPVSNTVSLFPGAMALAGPPTLTAGLLALRATRPVLVGLVPLVIVWLVMLVAMATAFNALGVTFEGAVTPRAVAAGLAATLVGIGLAAWQIRRGLPKGSLVLMFGLMLAGTVLGRLAGFTFASGVMTGVGFNGLITLATWWLFERFVRFRENGHLPDEVFHYGFAWLGLAILLPKYTGVLAWPWSVIPFVACCVTLQRLLRRGQQRAATRVPRRLLLLRPFNNGRLRSALLDALDRSWRRFGTLDLVVGGDLAVRTVSGPVLESVLLGTMRRHFLRRIDEVHERLARLPRRVALDGRFPLNEVHCDPAVWQAVVTALADEADVVLMDLRGMGARNRGALFELRMAVQRVELSRIVLLADSRTDERALAEVAEEAWRARPEISGVVNHDSRLVVLRCSGRVARDNPWIVEKVFAACGPGPERSAPPMSDRATPAIMRPPAS
jgi:hypothetical protein